MPKPRTFASAPPSGWISRDELLVETGIGERLFAGWAEQLGLRTCLVSRGRGGSDSYYPSESVATIKRLRDLSRHPPRNWDDWRWRLWIEGHEVDIRAWARGHLASGLKKLGRHGSSGSRLIGDRVRRPIHRTALSDYADLAAAGRAGPARDASMHNADPPILDLVLRIGGLPRNAGPPSGELRNVEHTYEFSLLDRILGTATDDELGQARRDWQTLARWVDAAQAVDWNAVSPDVTVRIKSMTGERPDPPSWRARKAQRRRPLPPPDLVRFLMDFWPELAARAAVLPLLIHLRRSPALNAAITEAVAIVDLGLSSLPRQASTTQRGTANELRRHALRPAQKWRAHAIRQQRQHPR
jgi:hypothetical protein